jgi:hypothetical protein
MPVKERAVSARMERDHLGRAGIIRPLKQQQIQAGALFRIHAEVDAAVRAVLVQARAKRETSAGNRTEHEHSRLL